MSNNIGSLAASSEDQNATKTLPFLVVEYDGQKAIIGRNTQYEETVEHIKKVFGVLRDVPSSDIRLCAKVEELDDTFRIGEELWPDLSPRLMSVKLILDPPPSRPRDIQVMVDMDETAGCTGTLSIEVLPSCTISQLKAKIEEKKGLNPDQQRLRHTLKDDKTLTDYGIQTGSTVELSMSTRQVSRPTATPVFAAPSRFRYNPPAPAPRSLFPPLPRSLLPPLPPSPPPPLFP